MIRMRQRHEAEGKHVLVANIFGAHLGEPFPGHAPAELHTHAGLHCLATRHGDAYRGTVAKVVALLQQRFLMLHDGRLRRLHAGHDARKVLLNDHRRVAGWLLSSLLREGCANGRNKTRHKHSFLDPIRSNSHKTSPYLLPTEILGTGRTIPRKPPTAALS